MERLLAGICTAVYWFEICIITGSWEGEEGGSYLHSPAQILTKSHWQNSPCSCLLPFLIPWNLIFYRFLANESQSNACNVLQQKRGNSSSHITTLGVSHNDSTFIFNAMAATLSFQLQQARVCCWYFRLHPEILWNLRYIESCRLKFSSLTAHQLWIWI